MNMKNTFKKMVAILGITGISIVSFAVPPTNIRKPKTNISQPKKKSPGKDDKRIKNFINWAFFIIFFFLEELHDVC